MLKLLAFYLPQKRELIPQRVNSMTFFGKDYKYIKPDTILVRKNTIYLTRFLRKNCLKQQRKAVVFALRFLSSAKDLPSSGIFLQAKLVSKK